MTKFSPEGILRLLAAGHAQAGFLGTFLSFFRTFERPIAMACLRLFTFLPLQPHPLLALLCL